MAIPPTTIRSLHLFIEPLIRRAFERPHFIHSYDVTVYCRFRLLLLLFFSFPFFASSPYRFALVIRSGTFLMPQSALGIHPISLNSLRRNVQNNFQMTKKYIYFTRRDLTHNVMKRANTVMGSQWPFE